MRGETRAFPSAYPDSPLSIYAEVVTPPYQQVTSARMFSFHYSTYRLREHLFGG